MVGVLLSFWHGSFLRERLVFGWCILRCQKLTYKNNPPILDLSRIGRSFKNTQPHKQKTNIQPHHHMGVQKNRHTHTHCWGVFFWVQNTFLPRLVSMKFIVFWIFINLFGVQARVCSWKPGWNQVVYINVGYVGWLVKLPGSWVIVKFWNNHQISSEFI